MPSTISETKLFQTWSHPTINGSSIKEFDTTKAAIIEIFWLSFKVVKTLLLFNYFCKKNNRVGGYVLFFKN